jgi:hypothetical protein
MTEAGSTIALSGAKSTATNGTIVRYQWSIDGSSHETETPNYAAPAHAVGKVHVQLVVVDSNGNASAPAGADVIVASTAKPTAVIDAPRMTEAGSTIALSGAKSTATNGAIVRYRWTVDGTSYETTAPDYMAPAHAAGRIAVQLVVVDSNGNQSAPVSATIVVR